jgi:hypothetical protein
MIAYSEEEIDDIGSMLEANGMTHEQIDRYFEHSGVPGMKWGVRRERRQQALVRAGTKGGPISSRIRGATGRLGVVDLVRGRGIRGGLERKSKRVGAQLERHKAGKSTAMDLIKRYGSTRITDIVPVRSKNANKKTSYKSDQVMVGVAGALIADQILRRGGRTLSRSSLRIL